MHSCTDGGFTGCLLLLVSKSMRASSRSIRFHTIAVHGTLKQYQLAGWRLTTSRWSDSCSLQPWKAGRREKTGVVTCTYAVSVTWMIATTQLRQQVEKESRQYREDLAELFRPLHLQGSTDAYGWYDYTDLPPIKCPEGFPLL